MSDITLGGVPFTVRQQVFLAEAIETVGKMMSAGTLPCQPDDLNFDNCFWMNVRIISERMINALRAEDCGPVGQPERRSSRSAATRLDIAAMVVSALIYNNVIVYDVDDIFQNERFGTAMRTTAGVLQALLPYQGEDVTPLPFEY
jgi:hypothetical protein